MESTSAVVQEVSKKISEVKKIAKEVYNINLDIVRVSYDLKGRCAGIASYRRYAGVSEYKVRFNYDLLFRSTAEARTDMIEDTIPHEFAHIVCYMRPELGKNHDRGWERVCETLGGSGNRTHKLKVVRGRGTTYEFITDRGHTVRIGDKHYAQLQRCGFLTWSKGKGSVTTNSPCKIVGQNGRMLTTPVEFRPQAKKVVQQVQIPATQPAAVSVTPVNSVSNRVQPVQFQGESKAAVSRRIMLSGYRGGRSYEEIISAMIAANGYDRQLARATFKANAPKVGIPVNFYL